MLNSGYDAVKEVSPSTVAALHLAEGGDLEGTRWWFDNAVSHGVRFDAIGLSYYGYWHGTLHDFQTTLDDAAGRYGKPVFVAETAYPFRLDSEDGLENIIDLDGELVPGYPASTTGQTRWMNDVASIVEAVPNGRGLGRLLLGGHLDRPRRQRLGPPPTPPPATAGRTRRCSATTTARCPRRRGSATGESAGPAPPTGGAGPNGPRTRAGRAPDRAPRARDAEPSRTAQGKRSGARGPARRRTRCRGPPSTGRGCAS
ncbi:hypothetical protein GCM10023238_09310 [Streptomyces heliomycini]